MLYLMVIERVRIYAIKVFILAALTDAEVSMEYGLLSDWLEVLPSSSSLKKS